MPPRKTLALRERNGKPQRQPHGPSPTEVRRAIEAATAGLREGVWGTMLGRLRLTKRLTDAQFTAGIRWATLARDYTASTAGPRQPRSAALDPSGGSSLDPFSPAGLAEAERHSQTVHRYLGALEMLRHTGNPARLAVEAVCELDLHPTPPELEHLKRGLDVLYAWWNGKRK
jgi:hypothetical protein